MVGFDRSPADQRPQTHVSKTKKRHRRHTFLSLLLCPPLCGAPPPPPPRLTSPLPHTLFRDADLQHTKALPCLHNLLLQRPPECTTVPHTTKATSNQSLNRFSELSRVFFAPKTTWLKTTAPPLSIVTFFPANRAPPSRKSADFTSQKRPRGSVPQRTAADCELEFIGLSVW